MGCMSLRRGLVECGSVLWGGKSILLARPPLGSLAPILFFSDKKGVKLFTLGEPASLELEHLPEHLCKAGDTAPLTALLEANPNVTQVVQFC